MGQVTLELVQDGSVIGLVTAGERFEYRELPKKQRKSKKVNGEYESMEADREYKVRIVDRLSQMEARLF